MLQEVYVQAEGEEQLVFFKEGAADIYIEGVSKVILEYLQSVLRGNRGKAKLISLCCLPLNKRN